MKNSLLLIKNLDFGFGGGQASMCEDYAVTVRFKFVAWDPICKTNNQMIQNVHSQVFCITIVYNTLFTVHTWILVTDLGIVRRRGAHTML